MKKTKFYSVITDWQDGGKRKAELHDGWTDGLYNYYMHTFESGAKLWYAIHPVFGLSVSTANTRKEAATIAYNKSKDVAERVANPAPYMLECKAIMDNVLKVA